MQQLVLIRKLNLERQAKDDLVLYTSINMAIHIQVWKLQKEGKNSLTRLRAKHGVMDHHLHKSSDQAKIKRGINWSDKG